MTSSPFKASVISLLILTITEEMFSSRAIVGCDNNWQISVYAVQPLISENGPEEGTIVFFCGGPAPFGGGLTINYNIGGTAVSGVDYQSLPSSVNIPGGSTTAVMKIRALADSVSESNESILLTLRPGTCNFPNPNASVANVTIKDKDAVITRELQPRIRWSAGQNGFINGVTVSPDGQLVAAGSQEGNVFVYSAKNGELHQTLTGHSAFVNHVVFSRDSKKLASSSYDRSVTVWDLSTGTTLRRFTSYDFIQPMIFTSDGKLIFGGGGGVLQLWNLDPGTLERTYTGHQGAIWSLHLSPDGTQFVSSSGASENTIKLWNVNSSTAIRTFSGHTADIWTVRFSTSGEYIASGSSDAAIRVWDVATRTSRTISGLGVPVLSLAFTPDDKYLCAGIHMPENKVKIFKFPELSLEKTFEHETFIINYLAFNKSGTSMVYGREDGLVVYAANPFAPGLQLGYVINGSELTLNWSGGNGPYRVQKRQSLSSPWENVGNAISGQSYKAQMNGLSEFFRIEAGDY